MGCVRAVAHGVLTVIYAMNAEQLASTRFAMIVENVLLASAAECVMTVTVVMNVSIFAVNQITAIV